VNSGVLPQTLNIVGCGKLGRAMAALWRQAGVLRIGAICNSTRASSERAVSILGAGTVCESIAEMPPAEVWMIATPDSEIAPSAERISGSASVRTGDVLFHCSGALTSDVLAPLRGRGASIGSLHPVRSFADAELASKDFAGTFCALEGENPAVDLLVRVCTAVGARVFTIEPQVKALCHAGHVFASNYLVTVLDVAQRLYRAAGLPDDVVKGLIEPLARSAVENVCMLGSERALTGPVVRGDCSVVAEHVRALEVSSAEYTDLYRHLGNAALEIARQRGEASKEELVALAELLGIERA
jgi:predicted short-subunit dehydrogenase-like oxidoreductase (DUF2520 family)